MDGSWFFVVLGAGLGVGLALWRIYVHRTPASADSPAERPDFPDPVGGASLQSQVAACGVRAQDAYDAVSHPEELMQNEAFRASVNHLSGKANAASDLVALLPSDNGAAACVIVEALTRRADAEAHVEDVVGRIRYLNPWPLYFVLRFLQQRATSGTLVGTVIAQARDWWSENWAIIQFLGPFVEARLASGEEPTFGERLQGLTPVELDHVDAMLRAMRNEGLTPLVAELGEARDTQIDIEFLTSIGTVWPSDKRSDGIIAHAVLDEQLERIKSSLLRTPSRSVLLVGEPGVGKSTLAQLAASWLQEQGWRIFEASATDVLAGQVYIGELEARFPRMMGNLGSAKRVAWLAPNFHELLSAGRHRYNPVGVLDMLLPLIEAGEVTIVGETNPQAFERIVQARQRVQSAMEVVRISALDEKASLKLAQAWARREGTGPDRPVLSSDELEEVGQLVNQYLGEGNSPGNLLQTLKLTQQRLCCGDVKPETFALADVLDTLSGLTGLPESILDDRQGLDLQALRSYFHRQVIGQPEAVDCLVERIAMLKAGLTDPARPLAVLLFVGPTGTGKTQLAKSLAQFLFGAADRMLRLDMSEFQTPESLDRIFGPAQEESAARSLVNSIRRQPFSVVLLDEFEKAHANVWDVFLQVFDDGRLTDRLGNTADFRHAMIILTSNLGGAISRGTSIGFTTDGRSFSRAAVDKAVAATFRPEFINRLDRVVTFVPLTRATMRSIVRKELGEVLNRRGLRSREWALECEDSAIEFLLEKGFTAHLGARPLRRAIEQHLLAPLASTIVEHQFPEGDQFLYLRARGEELEVEFIDPDAPPVEAPSATPDREGPPAREPEQTVADIALDARGTPGELAVLEVEYERLATDLRGEAWENDKGAALASTAERAFWEAPERFVVLERIEVMDRIESGLHTAGSLIRRLRNSARSRRQHLAARLVRRLAMQLYLVGAAHDACRREQPQDAFIVIEATPDSREPASAFDRRVRAMYEAWARKRRMRCSMLEDDVGPGNGSTRAIYAVSGFGAHAILKPESGLHVLEMPSDGRQTQRRTVHVRVLAQPCLPSRGQTELLRRALEALGHCDCVPPVIVRTYRELPSPLVRDHVRKWRTGRIDRVLGGDFDLIS